MTQQQLIRVGLLRGRISKSANVTLVPSFFNAIRAASDGDLGWALSTLNRSRVQRTYHGRRIRGISDEIERRQKGANR